MRLPSNTFDRCIHLRKRDRVAGLLIEIQDDVHNCHGSIRCPPEPNIEGSNDLLSGGVDILLIGEVVRSVDFCNIDFVIQRFELHLVVLHFNQVSDIVRTALDEPNGAVAIRGPLYDMDVLVTDSLPARTCL